jgi:cell division control protein 6
MNDDTIIHNELPLTEAFIPTRLLHREGKLRELERCLKPLLHGKLPENVFLVGPTGTGKTILATWILESHFQYRSAYINCWKYRSTHEVLKEILLSLEVPTHGREPTSNLIKRLERLLKQKKILVCLDEVDQLKRFDVLYILARQDCGLILISNDYHALMHLDSRIRSRLSLTEIEFPTYKPDELLDILKDRVEYSFTPGSLPKELIKIASRLAGGDARIGLEILRRAGRKAEDKDRKKVTLEEIKEASKEAKKLKKSYLLDKLNDHQRIIYEILERRRKIASGPLYTEYCSLVKKPVVTRAYRNYMMKMVKFGLVKAEGYGRWKRYEIVI